VIAGLLRTSHPVPSRLIPALAAATVFRLALPIFLLAGWRLGGWGLGAVLWLASELFSLLLARVKLGVNALARSGVVAFGMMFRAIAIMVVLIAVAASHPSLALAAALVFALAYTLELGLSLTLYFTGERR
jgi:hypothetical protein